MSERDDFDEWEEMFCQCEDALTELARERKWWGELRAWVARFRSRWVGYDNYKANALMTVLAKMDELEGE